MKPGEPGTPLSRRMALGFGLASLTIGIMMTSTSEIAAAPAPRPATWAEAVELEGVPNLHRVTPSFYRSAQPTEEGFANLSHDLGVKSIVSLRAERGK